MQIFCGLRCRGWGYESHQLRGAGEGDAVSDTPQPEHIRLWALENAVQRNKYASTERVLEEARRFEQYISGRQDAEIVSITAKESAK